MSGVFLPLFITFRWQDALDIVLVALLCYQLYRLVRGTAALNIFVGILIFYSIYRLVRVLDLELFSSILGKFIDVGVIALLIVFQQELRRFFLFIGTNNLFRQPQWRKALFNWRDEDTEGQLDINAVVKACRNMAGSRTGAILVFARNSDLKFYSNTGDPIDARVSVRMIESIFFKNSPLHDGAVIISGNIIRAARCVLPVTENNEFPAHLGMRHRASVGITENTDAIAIAVSEQTGEIAFARDGQMESNVSPERLKELLEKYLMDKK
ncbi:MAG: diadenylate cyclase CdaA [Bacteroidia bacterium]|nr:diadenylate cyclase CdaA [Bacteroidia bacterium]